jgi:F-type H+-transporting ATPase subunit epsilon
MRRPKFESHPCLSVFICGSNSLPSLLHYRPFLEIAVAKTIRCTIVTPSAAVFDEQVTYASFPAWDGQQGVMTGQSPLLTRLGIGTLRLDLASGGGGSKRFLIDGGFGQVQNDVLTLLTEGATPAENVSLQEAQAELAEANARIPTPGNNLKKVEHDQQLALAKVALAKSTTEAQRH